MTNDMFKSKSDQLLDFCKQGVVSKSAIMRWGYENYYISADRIVRKFVEKGLMRRIPKEECLFKGFIGKQAYYEVTR